MGLTGLIEGPSKSLWENAWKGKFILVQSVLKSLHSFFKICIPMNFLKISDIYVESVNRCLPGGATCKS